MSSMGKRLGKQLLWKQKVVLTVLLSYEGNEIGQQTPAHWRKKTKEYSGESMHTYCFRGFKEVEKCYEIQCFCIRIVS